jgi:hypothetical protein
MLFNPATTPQLKFYMPSIQAAASSLAIEANSAPVHARDEIEGVIAAQARNPGGSLIVMPDVCTDANRELIIALTARYGVPAIYSRPVFAESGGLIAYGVDLAEQFRLAAGYIDRILKGAKPGDLPIQRPTKFEFVINLKTAKALGLTVPDRLLAIADEVRMTRRLPAPWHADKFSGGYVVRDANGFAVAYVYGRSTEAEAMEAKQMTMDEARRVASNIAKLPDMLKRGEE